MNEINRVCTCTMNVVIYCSEISAILGCNPFTSRFDAITKIQKRCDPHFRDMKLKEPDDWLRDIARTDAGKEVMSRCLTVRDSKERNSTTEALRARLEQEGKLSLCKSAGQFVAAEIGRNSEELAEGIIGPLSNVQKRFQKELWSSRDKKYHLNLSGRIDCMDAEGNVVEIKTRTSQISKVDAKDTIQLQAYMFLAGVSQGYILELFPNDRCEIHPTLTFDRILWDDTVMSSLMNVVDFLILSHESKMCVREDDFEGEIDIDIDDE